MAKTQPPKKLVTLEELSRLTGHTYRTVRDRLVTLEPVKTDGRSRLYDPQRALALIYDRGEPTGLDLSQERAALAQVQRQKLEREIRKMDGELVDAKEHARLIESLIVTVRSRLLVLPRRASAEANPENPRHAESILNREVENILTELVSPDTFTETIERALAVDGEGVGSVSTAAKAVGL